MGKGSQTTTTQQQQSYQPTGAPQIQTALTQAQNAAQLPFNIPQAPVAGFSQDQQAAFGNINNAQGMAQPYINQAQQYFSPQGAQQFMNPYAANVMAGMKDVFGQQASQNTGQLTQAAGGVGADRIAVGQSELARQQDLSAGQTLAGLYGQSVQQAQSAGYGTAALGSQAQNAALSGAQAQLASGGLQQQLQQAQMNSPYQQQLAQAAFPYQQAQFLAGITGSLAPGLGGTTSGTGSTTGPAPSMLSQILGLGTAGVGAAGSMGAFGGSGGKGSGGVGNYGQASNATGYGAGTGGISFPMFARGGGIGYAEGGATESSPFDLPPNFNDKPINVAEHSIIPTVQTPAIRPEMPKLNLNPPAQSAGSSGPSMADVAKLAMMFINRGGRVPNNPYARGGVAGYADGGAAFGTLSPGEEAERPPNILDNAVSSGIGSLATLPKRAIDASAQDVQHLGDPDYQRQSIGPALETAMTMTGGAGAIPAEANTLRAGLKFPPGYYDKVPMDMRLSRKGISHPGLRWEVYDPKTGEVLRKDVATSSGANLARDRLDNKYGAYRYQTRPVRAKELTESEAQFLKDKDISFDAEPGMARGGRTKNPYAFAPGGEVTDEERALGYQMLREGMGTRAPDSIPGGEPAPEPYRMPSRGAYEDWQKGADTQMALSGNDGSATPVATKPAFPPPSGSHGRSVGAPAIETPEDAPQDVSARSRTPAAPQEDTSEGTPAGKSGRFVDSPWAALMAAGLGIAGGTSPFAAVNIGQGGLQGLKTLQEQRASGQKDETIAQATRRLDIEAKHHEDQFTRMTPYQKYETSKPVPMGQTIGPLGLPMTTYGIPDGKGGFTPINAPTPTTQQEADNPVKNIVDGIKSGKLPPDTTGLYRLAPAVKSGLAKDGFDLTQAQLEMAAAKKQILSLNGPQMVRFVGLAKSVDQTINEVKTLSEQMKNSGIPLLNQAKIAELMQLEGNSEKGQLAARYVGAVNTLKEEFANLANGGYAPTEPAWKLANEQINGNYGVKQLGASLEEVQRLIRYRLQGIPNMNTLGPGSNNRYVPGADASHAPAAPAAGAAPAVPAAAPVAVASPEEARKLPSGTPIRLPDGRTGTVP